MRLEGKTALVTGASHGIGRAIALTFAREGADIAFTWRSREEGALATAREIEALGQEVVFSQAEMTNPDDCARAVDTAIEQLGKVDILVNNAGGGRGDRLIDLTPDDWRYTLDLCVTAPFLLGQRVARHLVERGAGGAMLNISSVHSANAWPNDTAYGVAKAGLNRLTESMALEWARFGIRVNCIAPGRYQREETHASPLIPLRRTGRPDEIASAALFLCSDESSYVTGRTLFVDGGLLIPPLTTAEYMGGTREARGFSG